MHITLELCREHEEGHNYPEYKDKDHRAARRLEVARQSFVIYRCGFRQMLAYQFIEIIQRITQCQMISEVGFYRKRTDTVVTVQAAGVCDLAQINQID